MSVLDDNERHIERSRTVWRACLERYIDRVRNAVACSELLIRNPFVAFGRTRATCVCVGLVIEKLPKPLIIRVMLALFGYH